MKKSITIFLFSAFILQLSAQEAAIHWLKKSPGIASGQSWGIPWQKGKIQKNQMFILKNSSGKSYPVQSWPLAYWPDGSVKWSGMAASLPVGEQGPFNVQSAQNYVIEHPLTVTQNAQYININTGVLEARIPLSGNHIIENMIINGTTVVTSGQLVCTLEDRGQYQKSGTVLYQEFTGNISSVSLEQSGPVRAVVKIQGMHHSSDNLRDWLPFTVRLYFYAGQYNVRMVHSIVFDGDDQKDFIKDLGVVFNVPFREEIQNRHVCFSGENGGLWAEPVQPLIGRGGISHPEKRNVYQAQLAGERIPDKSTFNAPNQQLLTDYAMWDGFKLSQVSADGFSVIKRTGSESSWLAAGAGKRSEGLAYVGDVSGGLAVSLKNFWQSFPASLEVQKARSREAQLKIWMWSPDAQPMDLRHYDTIAHGLNSTYEDVQKGLSTPYGVARTSELIIYPVYNVPSKEELVEMSSQGAEPSRLMSTPEYLHEAGAFGNLWSLPDRSNPTRTWMENQLDSSVIYYRKMIDEQYWYGFWNYGDVMHSQDPQRHKWRYDIGGTAWDNSELGTDMWLWYSFLRTGDPDIFKMAEAMTRHTGEVDCYHIGPLKGLGSRHNVSHWGCGAKESRIAQAGFRRFYYYLTTDERVGDVMHEMIDAETSIIKLDPLRNVLPFDQAPVDAPARVRFGPDWISLVANWMTEWERTGDTKWRDKINTGMTDFSKFPHGIFSGKGVFGLDPATGTISLRKDQMQEVHSTPSVKLAMVMGGFEVMSELLESIDNKAFKNAWIEYCEYYSMPVDDPERSAKNAKLPSNSFLLPRLTAYAAKAKNDPKIAQRAWSEFLERNNGLKSMYSTKKVKPPYVLNELDENGRVGTNDAAQWGLNAIFLPQILGNDIPDVKTLKTRGGPEFRPPDFQSDTRLSNQEPTKKTEEEVLIPTIKTYVK
jgi:hypothetical protein